MIGGKRASKGSPDDFVVFPAATELDEVGTRGTVCEGAGTVTGTGTGCFKLNPLKSRKGSSSVFSLLIGGMLTSSPPYVSTLNR